MVTTFCSWHQLYPSITSWCARATRLSPFVWLNCARAGGNPRSGLALPPPPFSLLPSGLQRIRQGTGKSLYAGKEKRCSVRELGNEALSQLLLTQCAAGGWVSGGGRACSLMSCPKV